MHPELSAAMSAHGFPSTALAALAGVLAELGGVWASAVRWALDVVSAAADRPAELGAMLLAAVWVAILAGVEGGA